MTAIAGRFMRGLSSRVMSVIKEPTFRNYLAKSQRPAFAVTVPAMHLVLGVLLNFSTGAWRKLR
jgi:hypothetical protein